MTTLVQDDWFTNWPTTQFNTTSNANYGHFLPFFFHLTNVRIPEIISDDNPTVGPFKIFYQWRQLDFFYPTEIEKNLAIAAGDFVPENNLPLGLETFENRLFITMPKWKDGVPCTLAVLPKRPMEMAPKLAPYPNWDYHSGDSCYSLTSVFRVQADSCRRLWVLDSGQIHITTGPKQICPPAIFIFDLDTDELILRYEFPSEFIKQDGLYSNIVVDVRDNDCLNVHAYIADVWRYGLVVYSLKKRRGWRITHRYFYPDPEAALYRLHGLRFEWTDGLFGMVLSPHHQTRDNDRLLYFHPIASYRQFYVPTSIICNESGWKHHTDAFRVIGERRDVDTQVASSGMAQNGVIFYSLVTKDAIGCWNSYKNYRRHNVAIIAKDEDKMIFPNDLKIDQEMRQSVWILTNRLPFYLYRKLDKNDYNFRIMSAYVDEAIHGTVCQQNFDFLSK